VSIDTHDDRPWHTDIGHLFLGERWLHQWAGGQNLDGTIVLVMLLVRSRSFHWARFHRRLPIDRAATRR
jgi:hypothetical protein